MNSHQRPCSAIILSLNNLMLRFLFIITAVFFMPHASWATNPPPGGSCSTDGGGCDKGQDGITSETVESFHFSVNIGKTPVPRNANFLDFAREGLSNGYSGSNGYQGFDSILNDYLSQGNQTSLEPSYLNIDQGNDPLHENRSIVPALYSPKIFDFRPVDGLEIIERNSAVRQTLSTSALTDISIVDDGFVVSVWNRDLMASKVKNTDGLYDLPPLEEAIITITFKNPDHPSALGRLVLSKVENFSGSASYRTTKHIDQTDPDNIYVTLYQGDGVNVDQPGNATILSEEHIAISERGARPWDYTIVKTVKTATNNDGVLGAPALVSRTKKRFEDFSFEPAGGAVNGKRLMEITVGYQEPDAATTTYTYHDTPNNVVKHGRLRSKENPDGSWEYCDYTDSLGSSVAIETKYRSWKDITIENRENAIKEVTRIEGNIVTRTTTLRGTLINDPSSNAETVTTISNESHRLSTDPETGNISHIYRQSSGSNDYRTVTQFASPLAAGLEAGRIIRIAHADGTSELRSYSGTPDELTVTCDRGEFINDSIMNGTRTIKTYNIQNRVIYEEHVDIETGLQEFFRAGSMEDSSGRPQRWEYNGNPEDFETMIYGCCGLESSRDRNGATTIFYRDALKRAYRVVRKRSPGGPPVTTKTFFNGLTTRTEKSSTAGTLLLRENTRSLSGLTVDYNYPDADGDEQEETSQRVTTYPNTGGSIVTMTYPDGTTTVRTTFRSGQTKSSQDQEGHLMTYDYGPHSLSTNGLFTKTIQPGGQEFVIDYRDQFGRSVRMEYSDGAHSTSEYHPFDAGLGGLGGSRGRLKTRRDADEVATPGTGSRMTYEYEVVP